MGRGKQIVRTRMDWKELKPSRATSRGKQIITLEVCYTSLPTSMYLTLMSDSRLCH